MFCSSLGITMCWMCGCADHVGLGNERETDNNEKNEDSDIIKK